LTQRILIKEVQCKTVLHRLQLNGAWEYTANFYRGCTHGCSYCYVPSLIHDERSWGSFVDVKMNAPQVLNKELFKVDKNVVFLSSATDPYQSVEARYKITRKCLEILLSHGFPVLILTRSQLVLRDLDLLKRFEWIRVGFSISTVPSRVYEPGVASLEKRIECLRKISDQGVPTWVSLAPVIPQLMLVDLEQLMKTLCDAGVRCVVPGLLRMMNYDESRKMFERVVAAPYTGFLKGGVELMRKVDGMIERNGLEPPRNFFKWTHIQEAGLDKFLYTSSNKMIEKEEWVHHTTELGYRGVQETTSLIHQ